MDFIGQVLPARGLSHSQKTALDTSYQQNVQAIVKYSVRRGAWGGVDTSALAVANRRSKSEMIRIRNQNQILTEMHAKAVSEKELKRGGEGVNGRQRQSELHALARFSHRRKISGAGIKIWPSRFGK